ncbi:PAS domain-containing protein [Jannaschia sp. KMU-145]|uniref:PAS domain-containing protein n=1 Tax=Jannaschia halovivens TaxID=3388667 RepID=UPI00396B11D0
MAGYDDTTRDVVITRISTGDAARGFATMRSSPILEEAWRYWLSLRRGTALPRRDALDPNAMRVTVGHSMIIDRVRAGTVRVRLGGRVMRDLMGMDVRGLPIKAFFALPDRDRATALVEEVFETGLATELDLACEGSEGVVGAKMLILPLLDAAFAVTKAQVVVVTDRVIAGDAPRRFSVTGHRLRATARSEHHPMRRATDRAAPLPMELAEAATPYAPGPSAVPWLRVVK